MSQQEQSQNQADAARLGLPRIAWQAMPYRVVEYYDDDQDRILLTLERWDGTDRLGQDRWQTVAAADRDDADAAGASARRPSGCLKPAGAAYLVWAYAPHRVPPQRGCVPCASTYASVPLVRLKGKELA